MTTTTMMPSTLPVEPAASGVTRREFIQASAAAAAGTAAFGAYFSVRDAEALTTGQNTPDPTAAATGQSIVYRYSTCQNCHSRCGLQAKIVGTAGSTTPGAGVLVKLDGNPYNQQNMEEGERLKWADPIATANVTPGRLCPKGQAGVQTLYDPYRLKHPLKRVGSRGSGQWQTITWATAFQEIADRIKQVLNITGISQRLTLPINANIPRLGPIANQLMVSPGRLPDGEMLEKIFKNTFGTSNYRLDHTSICEVSHHVANELMTWASGKKNHFKPDVKEADYVILFGANYLEANFPMLGLARHVSEMLRRNPPGKLVVVDPRFSNSAAKAASISETADRWVPAKPGTDGAVALGIATHIIKSTLNMGTGGSNDRGTSDTTSPVKYLRNANSAAAVADNESTFTDAPRLVVMSTTGALNDVSILESGDTNRMLSGWVLNGVRIGTNTDAGGVLYVNLLDETPGGGQAQVDIYRTSAKLAGDLVATGFGANGSTIALNEANASGIFGAVTIGTVAANDTDIRLTIRDQFIGKFLRWRDVGVVEANDAAGVLANWALNGVRIGSTTDAGGVMYVNLTDELPGAGQATVDIYRDAARTQLVATGFAANNNPVTLGQANASGLTGRVDLGAPAATNNAITLTTSNNFVSSVGGVATEIAAAAAHGDLLPGQQTYDLLNGTGTVTVKTSFQVLFDNVISPSSVDDFANIAGVDRNLLIAIAGEFFAAGKKAVANPYRGTVQHTNGLWSMMGVQLLNALAGNYDWKGGNNPGAGGWGYKYAKDEFAAGDPPYAMAGSSWSDTGAPLPIFQPLFGNGPYGPRIDRAKATGTYSFEDLFADGFDTYPAERPWFPYGTHGNYQEIIPGIASQYPMPCKVLITYWNLIPYSTPAARNVFYSTVQDPAKVPLFIAIDNQMSEVSAYADYILPDTTYLEKWAFPGGSNVSFLTKYTPLRQPLVGAFDARAWDAAWDTAAFNATNAYNPIYPDTKMFEDILIGLMNALGLTKEIGSFTAGANSGNDLPANAWAHWKHAVRKLAKDVGAATDPGKPGITSATDVLPILDRGGAFQDAETSGASNSYDVTGTKLRYGFGSTTSAKELRLYFEELALMPDSMGDGTARLAPSIAAGGYLAVAHFEGVKDIRGDDVMDFTYPFQLITYKKVLHGQARTQNLPWLTCWQPENFIEMNTIDATSLGLRTYDRARVTSPSSPSGIEGRVWVTEGLRPGVIAISHHFGHWQQSSQAWQDSGVSQSTDATRALGIQPTQIMRLDPFLGDVTLQDKIGASSSFYDTRVAVTKVS